MKLCENIVPHKHKLEPIDNDMSLRIREQYIKILHCSYSDLPVFFDTEDENVCVFTINLDMPKIVIDKYPIKSCLANCAFSSSEISKNSKNQKRYVNLFQIMLKDKKKYVGDNKHRFDGNKSRVQEYLKLINKFGFESANVKYDSSGDSNIITVYHRHIGMHPVKFARNTAKALRCIGVMKQK